jgi:hypothetical protein
MECGFCAAQPKCADNCPRAAMAARLKLSGESRPGQAMVVRD